MLNHLKINQVLKKLFKKYYDYFHYLSDAVIMIIYVDWKVTQLKPCFNVLLIMLKIMLIFY